MLILYLLPLAISTITGLLLAYYLARRLPAPGALPLMGLVLAAMTWSVGYFLEIATSEFSTRIFWAGFQYLGIVAIAPTWAIFCAEYLGTPAWLAYSRRNRALLWIIPGLTLVILLTNPYHGLIWQSIGQRLVGDVSILEFHHGAWFAVILGYSYFLTILGSLWLATRLVSSPRLHRLQMGLAVLASLIPLFGSLLYVSPFNPTPGLDWTPFGFTIAGLLLAVSLFRYQLIEVVPVAHKLVFDRLEDAILVLDVENHLVDLNPAADQMILLPGRHAIGQPLARVFPELVGMVKTASTKEKTQRMETRLGEGAQARDFEVRITQLAPAPKARAGCLVVLHDVTQRRMEKELLRQARDELELRVDERTRELAQANQKIRVELEARQATEREQQQLLSEIQRSGSQLRAMAVRLQEVQELERHSIASELHDRVGQNLTGLNLNLQIIQNQLAALNKPALQTRLEDSLRLVEETTRLVRDVMADLVPPQLEEYGLVSALRWYAGIYTRRTGLEVQVVGNEFEPRLDHKVEIAYFRIVQEALNNIARHARASSVTISLEANEDLAYLCVKDNGMGFDPGQFPRPGDLGLITMKERAASVGALATIQSAPGQGTTVRIEYRRTTGDH